MIDIEVAYAGVKRQLIIPLKVVRDCTVRMAINQSGILVHFPEIDLTINKVGIFSKLVALDTILNEGDRVEVYRPLLIDPKLARKQRAKKRSTISPSPAD